MKPAFSRIVILKLLFAVATTGQSHTGELRLKILDPAGLAVRATAEIIRQANQFREFYDSDDAGSVTAKRLPFGVYKVEIHKDGFAPFPETIEVRSVAPTEISAKLTIAVRRSLSWARAHSMVSCSSIAGIGRRL